MLLGAIRGQPTRTDRDPMHCTRARLNLTVMNHRWALAEIEAHRSRTLVYAVGVRDDVWVSYRADSRAVLTEPADPVTLAQIIAEWPTRASLRSSVQQLWNRACGQFRSGSVVYENFSSQETRVR
jgi:hypothetical protein